MTKLRIDLKNGLLEVEGEEGFVKEIYGEYRDALSAVTARLQAPPTLVVHNDPGNQSDEFQRERSPKGRVTGARKESYSIVSDLNLRPEGKQSLRDFFAVKKPDTAMELNTVFVYYLERELAITAIGPDHVYTCYKEVSSKVPAALLQSLKDTAHRKGWIDTKNMNALRLSTVGENLVEHDLPRPEKIA